MVVEKNGRLYGKGTGLGGSAVINPNIFSYSEEFKTSWIFTQAKNIIIQEPKCILDK